MKNMNSCGQNGYYSSGLIRGYVGVWEVIDDKLYWVDIKHKEDPQKIFKETFPDSYIDGKVFADWFSSTLIIPKGDAFRWDGVFERTYYSEEHLIFKNGYLVKTENVNNYISVKNGISRKTESMYDSRSPRSVTDTIVQTLKTLNWNRLSDRYLCDDEYIVTIGADGRISDVKFVDEVDACKKCTRKLKRKLDNLRFDIIKWNGKPYVEEITIDLFYDEDTEELENWSY